MIQLACIQKLIAKLPVQQGLLPEDEYLQASLSKRIVNNLLSSWPVDAMLALLDKSLGNVIVKD